MTWIKIKCQAIFFVRRRIKGQGLWATFIAWSYIIMRFCIIKEINLPNLVQKGFNIKFWKRYKNSKIKSPLMWPYVRDTLKHRLFKCRGSKDTRIHSEGWDKLDFHSRATMKSSSEYFEFKSIVSVLTWNHLSFSH
jgi:hypothetical protein